MGKTSQPTALGTFLTGIVEVALALTGLWYFLLGSGQSPTVQLFLGLWGGFALLYLGVVGSRLRRRALADVQLPAPQLPAWSTFLTRRRFSFLLTVAASLTGLGAALDVLWPDSKTNPAGVTELGAFVMICAWLLLHLGYARFYSQWTGLRFPATEEPLLSDYLYFAVTVGVSFAASDVEVRSHRLRWHVMVHSIVSFFYNAIVLAVAVSIITGK